MRVDIDVEALADRLGITMKRLLCGIISSGCSVCEAVDDDHSAPVAHGDGGRYGNVSDTNADTLVSDEAPGMFGGGTDVPVSQVDGERVRCGVGVNNDELVDVRRGFRNFQVSQTQWNNLMRARAHAYPEMRERRKVELHYLIQVFKDIQTGIIDEVYQSVMEIIAQSSEDVAKSLRGGAADSFEVADRLDDLMADVRKHAWNIVAETERCQMSVEVGLKLLSYGLAHTKPLPEELNTPAGLKWGARDEN